jgi:FAD/FMN-containing dehydrogenase
MKEKLQQLAGQLRGDLYFDNAMRILYATDASAYREMPLAVAMPESVEDIKKLIAFARTEKTSLIPRAAGTSLAGQVVGKGMVVDISKNFTRILELNKEEGWVRVEPGVIRDELNLYLNLTAYFLALKPLLQTGYDGVEWLVIIVAAPTL